MGSSAAGPGRSVRGRLELLTRPDKAEALIVGEILAASEAVHGKDAVDAANLLGDALKAAAKRIHG